MATEVAKLLVSAGFDKGSASKVADEFEASLKTIDKKAHKLNVTPDTEAFQKNMKSIREMLEGEFKNINLNGILNGVVESQEKSLRIKDWLKETEKVLNTFQILKQIQDYLGKKGKSLELFNSSQLNQLIDFAAKKDILGMENKVAESSNQAKEKAKSIGTQYYYTSSDIEDAMKKRKILSGEKNLGLKTASILGIDQNSPQLSDATTRLELQNYLKMSYMISDLIKEKEQLGEIKTTEDAENYLRIMTELQSTFQQLTLAEDRIKKIFSFQDENGNVQGLIDDSRLLSNTLKDQFKNVDFDNLATMRNQAETQFINSIKQSVQSVLDSIRTQLFDKVTQMINSSVDKTVKKGEKARGEINKKREKNAGGSEDGEGSGTGGGSGTGSGFGGETVSGGSGGGSVGQYNQELDQLNQELKEAEAKLKQLKKGVDIDELIGGEGGEKVLRGYIDELEELARTIDGMDQSKISNKMKTQFAQIYDIINRNNHGSDLSDLVEDVMYGKIDPDGELDFDSIFKYVDKQAVEQQEQIISRLKQRISDVKNTPPTTVGDGVNTVDNGDSVTVKVKPDTSSFIADLKSQVEGETIEIKVTPESGSGDNFKQIIDEIPDTKEIKLSIIDYDKIPLMNDAAGNLVDVFRGTHGVFGINGENGVSWFTDELEVATQYADELSEDGKIIKANLAFKNPLEIFGEGADYDKIDISGLSDRIKNIANDLGFDVNKMLTDDIVTVAKHAGYDGVIFRDIKDGYDDLAHNVFAVVDSIQVKNEELYNSVKANTGELSDIETSPNQSETMRIRYDNIKNGISDVLSTPFDIIVEPKTDGIRSKVNGELDGSFDAIIEADASQVRPNIESVLASPFEIQIEPDNSLKAAISSMLDGENFKINLGVEIPDNAQKAKEAIENTMQSNQSPISSGTTTLPEQEQAAGQAAEQMGQNIADGANTGNEAVQRLSQSLAELFAKMQNSENEIFGLFGNTGLVDEISSDLTNKVKHEDIYRALLSNIENQVFGTIHNHPGGNFVFSGEDFSGIGNDTGSYENGNRLFGLLAGDKVKFIDFSGVDKEIARQFIQQYSQAEKEIKANLNPLLSDQEWNEQFNSLRLEKASELLNQFGLQNIVKTFDVADTNSISQFLINIQEKAQAAIDPVQNLINLVQFGAEKKLDLGSEEVQNILNAFKSGDLSAIQAFDKLMVNLGSDFHNLSVDDELDKFRTSFKELFGQEFYQNNFDVIQEQLEDQIFDQAKTAQEMMVKARELFKEKLSNETPVLSGETHIDTLYDELIKLRDLKKELAGIDLSSEDGIDQGYSLMYQIQELEDKLHELYSYNKDHHIIDAESTIDDISRIENKLMHGTILTMFRGTDNPDNPILSKGEHGGGTFFTDDIDSAKYYGENGKLYQAKLMIKDALEFIPDVNSMVDAVTFTGNGTDDVSASLKAAIDFVEQSGHSLFDFRNILMERYDEFRDGNDFVIPFDSLDEQLQNALMTIKTISEDTNNIYGVYRTTDTFAEKARTNGYDSLIIHDISEAFNQIGEEIKSTIAVIFDKNQLLSHIEIKPNETDGNQQNVDVGNVGEELEKLQTLKNFIETQIPAAIAIKNDAFNEEMAVVQNAVQAEIECFNLLIKTLSDVGENVAALDQFFKEMGGDNNLFDGLLHNLSDVGETIAALDSFFADFFQNIKVPTDASSFSELIKNLKITDKNINNIADLAAGIELLSQTINELNTSDISSGALSSINDLLKNADQLKDLASILSHSRKDIDNVFKNNTPKTLEERISELGFDDGVYNKILSSINNPGKILDIGVPIDLSTNEEISAYIDKMYKLQDLLEEFNYKWKASFDSDSLRMTGGIESGDDLQKAIDEYTELKDRAREFYDLKQIVDEKGRGSLTDSQRKAYDELATMYTHANQTAQQYNGTVQELTDSQKEFNDTLKEVEDAQVRRREEETNANIANEIRRTEKMMAKIKDGDKSRWSSQYADLENAVSQANDAFKNTGDVEKYTEAINNAFDTFNRYAKMPSGKIVGTQADSFDDARNYFENFVNSYKTVLKGVSGDTDIGADGMARFSAQVRDAEGNVEKLKLTWDSVNKTMVMSSQQMPKQLVGISGVIDGVKSKIKELATYWTARFFDPMDIMRYSKQIFSIIQQYDDALTEMRKVSNESVSSLKSFQVESFSKANEVGTTALQLQQSTADWLRLGENFQEAQKSAQTSNILLNVSEFTNISEATEALTSASQAYKEFEKIDIVDKLNNIGNNFSVSTDQLAKGLQNAAAVLKTQGNDLDQSLALLTSGNAITQDISKTSAGIRTISLRISGTEEAKDEIKDMGEDIDDFVVRTKSKTDAIIRDYTAVAKNNYKGVSVLDDNGNLRSTYDILLDIAEVYEDIQKMDKERGTNRAQALVETLAGKNRSNIAASILSNPQMLKDVYEMSKQSEGSAQEELDKYLDSISGKMQKLTNQLHELANIAIDSDGLKVMLDVVNALLSGVTSLAKQFGVINTVIGGIVGISLQRKGKGKSRRENALYTEHNNNAIMLLVQVIL